MTWGGEGALPCLVWGLLLGQRSGLLACQPELRRAHPSTIQENQLIETRSSMHRAHSHCWWEHSLASGRNQPSYTHYKMGIWVEPKALLLLVPMSHLISTPVTENQIWEQFYCVGEAKWNTKMDTSVPEAVNRAKSCVSWHSKQEKILIAVGFCSSPLQILVIFEFRLVSCFCSMLTAGLHTWALLPIDCLQGEEGKYQRPYIVQIPWLEPVGEKGRGKS